MFFLYANFAKSNILFTLFISLFVAGGKTSFTSTSSLVANDVLDKSLPLGIGSKPASSSF